MSETLSLLSRIREQESLDGVATFLTRLLQNPQLFEQAPSNVGLELEIAWDERPTPRDVTELSVQSIAFGMLLQQRQGGGPPSVRAPFTYRTPSEVQDACSVDGVPSLFSAFLRRPNGPIARLDASYAAQEFGVNEILAHHVFTMVVFGTFVEREGLYEVALS